MRSGSDASVSSASAAVAAASTLRPYRQVHNAPLSDQLKSRAFVQLLAFFSLASLWANLFVGTAALQLGDVFGRQVAGEYSGQLSLAMAAGLVCVPLSATVMDHHQYSYPLLAAVVAMSCLAWSLLQLAASPALIAPSFAFYAAFRSVLYTYTYSMVADVFDSTP